MTHDRRVVSDKTLALVAPLITFHFEELVMALANTSGVGLAECIFSDCV